MKQVSFLGSVSKQVIAQFAKSELTIAAAKLAEDKMIQRAVDTMALALARVRNGGLLRIRTDHEDNEAFRPSRRQAYY